MKLGYETTDKKIEIDIYGLVFEINNIDKLEELEDTEDDDLEGLKKSIEQVLGEGSVKKINEQRAKDGYEEMDNSVALKILIGIGQAYANEYVNSIMQPLEKSVDRINNYNRETRRYNKNNRNRGRYGRY